MNIQTLKALSPLMSDGRRFVVVGASGLIGKHLTRTIRAAGHHAVPLFRTHSMDDGVQFDMLRQRLRDVVPDLREGDSVVLLASHSDQAWISKHAAEARELNVEASSKLSGEVAAARAHFTFVSTESVFGQDSETGWPESSPPNPVTEYGRQKAEMERLVNALPGACVVRTGWNVGWEPEARCVIKATYQALLGADARMATDNVFTLTDVEDTARGICAAMARRLTGVWHFAGTPIRRNVLAASIVSASQFGDLMRYVEVKFSSLTFVEPRPARAWLSSAESLRRLGLAFRSAPSIIQEKVKLLDRYRDTLIAIPAV